MGKKWYVGDIAVKEILLLSLNNDQDEGNRKRSKVTDLQRSLEKLQIEDADLDVWDLYEE